MTGSDPTDGLPQCYGIIGGQARNILGSLHLIQDQPPPADFAFNFIDDPILSQVSLRQRDDEEVAARLPGHRSSLVYGGEFFLSQRDLVPVKEGPCARKLNSFARWSS